MLVLTRKPDQSIMVGEDIEITILEVRGEQVRIGIRAPKSVMIQDSVLLYSNVNISIVQTLR